MKRRIRVNAVLFMFILLFASPLGIKSAYSGLAEKACLEACAAGYDSCFGVCYTDSGNCKEACKAGKSACESNCS